MKSLNFAQRTNHSLARMRGVNFRWLGRLSLTLLLCTGYVAAQAAPDEYRMALDKVSIGQLPAGWVVAATHPSGPLAQWQVGVGAAASNQAKVLTIAWIQDASSAAFNLFWTNQIVFQDGEAKVRMRANSGDTDQGGGLIWRVKDENNYYVARYNPLESNFRLYSVKEGARSTLASAEGLKTAPGQWVELRITQHGQHIQGWFNNQLTWEVSDAQWPKAGGVGLWSKADAASSFADFVVRRAK